MRHVLTSLVFAVLFAGGCAEPVPEPPTADRDPPATEATNRGPLACTLRGEPTCELGTAPKLQVALINQTGEEIYLVGCLDGSSLKRRYPLCYFEVIGPDGQLVEREFRVRCGNMNTLRWVDFVAVPPGGTFDPCQRVDTYSFFSAGPYAKYFDAPGKYRVRFVYSTKGADIREWAGDNPWGDVENDETMIALFGRVPKVQVRSNAFEVTVLVPAK